MPKHLLNRHPSRRGKRLPQVPASKALVALACVAILAGIGYIVQVSADATKGYQIRDLEKQVADLKDQQQKAELQSAAGQSVQAVEDKVQGLGMVPTSSVDYLSDAPPSVAVR